MSEIYLGFSIEFTSEQGAHFESVKWLIHPFEHHAEGRTRVMALAFMSIAMDNPGRPVRVWDHSMQTMKADVYLLNMIQAITQSDKGFAKLWKFGPPGRGPAQITFTPERRD